MYLFRSNYNEDKDPNEFSIASGDRTAFRQGMPKLCSSFELNFEKEFIET